MNSSNPADPPDGNIPDPESRKPYRGSLAQIADRAATESKPDPDAIWAEDAGPGSYHFFWTRLIQRGPELFGWIALAISLAAIVGSITDTALLSGEFLSGPPVPMVSAVILATLALTLILMLDVANVRRLKAGRVLASLAFFAGVVLLGAEIANLDLIDWGDGTLRSAPIGAILNLLLVSAGFLTLDRDPPEYRWHRTLIVLIGVSLIGSVITLSYFSVIGTLNMPTFSYPGSAALLLIYYGFVFVRPDRSLASFLLATGPGPSMARLLLPTAVFVSLAVVLIDIAAEGLDIAEAALIKGLDKLLMLLLLVWMVTYASRRLQGVYLNWRQASSELASQADVLTRMSEGVALVRISDSRIVLTNPQFDAMHGYEEGELIGQPLQIIAPPDLTDEEIGHRNEVLGELAETGEASYENRAVRKDGASIWTRANAVVTTVPEHGSVLILVKYDVTEAHLAETAGRDAEMRFRQVFEQSPIGLCLISPDGGFEQVNRSFELITGYTSEELSEMTFADITHPEDLEKDLALTNELFDGKRDGFSLDKRYIRRNGDVVWIYLTVAMLRDQNGEPYQALSMVEDITERQRLQYLADHDPLTGLFNRRRLEDELDSAITAGHGRGIAILVIDLDNFKFVNDSFGHSTGDRLIVRTAELLKSRLRTNDTLARQGGDEFVVVLRDIPAEDALAKAEELVRLVGREVRVDGAEHSARVTASIGVAVASQGAPVPQETLMMQADIAMYEAKDAGRNGVRLFRPGEDSHVTLGIDWAGRLRTALENDELSIYTQPICRLDESGPPHHELFVRMRDRNGQVILPGAFLPTAERHDLVQDVDAWMIGKAINILKDLDSESGPRLQINLSGRTVGDPKLPDFVQGELEKAGVDPSRLIFEVTETSAIGNMTRAQEFSARMNELGCGFALDDFGTGFGSFYYLKHLAFDYVKIDGEFVQGLATDPVNQLLVRSLAEISRGMGKLTVAEQVEDAETLAMLGDFGIDFVQGFYLGRPRPLERSDLTTRPTIPVGTVGG